MLDLADGIQIDERDIEELFVRASGPGGQHVNKTSTAVQLRLNIERVSGLSDEARRRLAAMAGNRLGADGFLTIFAQKFRSQARNRTEAMEKLINLIQAALIEPKQRLKTKPGKAAKKKRLAQKRLQAQLKQGRRKVSGSDES